MQLQNTGDLGARFAWDTASLGPYFAVSPVEGHVEPGQEIALEVTFRPIAVVADARAEQACQALPCHL